MDDDAITDKIIGCAFEVHNALGTGFFEKVYENALCIELRKAGIQVVQQERVKVFYDGQVVGEYVADLMVEKRIIVELKAVVALTKEHETQLVNCLTATNTETGLLLNFGASVQVKRKYRRYKPAQAIKSIKIPEVNAERNRHIVKDDQMSN